MKNSIDGVDRRVVMYLLSFAFFAGLFVFGIKLGQRDAERERKAALEAEKARQEQKENELEEYGSEPEHQPTEAEDLALDVADTLGFIKEDGKLYLCYSQPDVPNKYHLSVSLNIYNSEGAELFRYISDAGWKMDASKYNPKEGIFKILLDLPEASIDLSAPDSPAYAPEDYENLEKSFSLLKEYDPAAYIFVTNAKGERLANVSIVKAPDECRAIILYWN